MSASSATPLRVGLIGLGRPGWHLIERFAATGPFRVVAAYADPSLAANVASFGVRLVREPQELVAAADVDVIWFAEHDAFLSEFTAVDALRQKHTIVATPLALSAAVAEQAFSEAARCNRLLLIHHPRRSDPDFRQVRDVALDATHGVIRAVKFVSWSYGLPPRGAIRGLGPLPIDASSDAQNTKLRFAAHALDQLLSLVSDRPIRVFATLDQTVAESSDLSAGYSVIIQIGFERGCQAEIDIRLDSPTQFQSGWLLTTERGGYANGKQFTLTEEGEVFDAPVPVPLAGGSHDDQFEWLSQQLRSGVRDTLEESRVRTAVALLDATQRSIKSGQAVEL